MANKEFNNIEQFIEGFTRIDRTPANYIYDGVIWGLDFLYKNRIFRITRDTVGNERKLQKKFCKSKKAYIQFYEIPAKQYPDESVDDLSMYMGIFYDVDDLLNNGKIDDIPLRDIIASDKTEILAID